MNAVSRLIEWRGEAKHHSSRLTYREQQNHHSAHGDHPPGRSKAEKQEGCAHIPDILGINMRMVNVGQERRSTGMTPHNK